MGSPNKTVTVTHGSGGSGSPIIDTSTVDPFGGTSGVGLFVAAAKHHIYFPDSSDFAFAGDFTCDLCFRPNSLPAPGGSMFLFSQSQSTGYDASNRQRFDLYNNAGVYQLRFATGGGGGSTFSLTVNSSPGLAVNQWFRAALVRHGTDLRIYENGTSIGSTTLSPSVTVGDFTGPLYLGSNGASYFYDGWMTQPRFSTVARWTTNFTPPTAPYSWDNGGIDTSTVLMPPMNSAASFFDVESTMALGTASLSSCLPNLQSIGMTNAHQEIDRVVPGRTVNHRVNEADLGRTVQMSGMIRETTIDAIAADIETIRALNDGTARTLVLDAAAFNVQLTDPVYDLHVEDWAPNADVVSGRFTVPYSVTLLEVD
jgi:hypothetical protein